MLCFRFPLTSCLSLSFVFAVLLAGCGSGVETPALFDGVVHLEVGSGDRSIEYAFPHECGTFTMDLRFPASVLAEMRALDHFEDGVMVRSGQTAEQVIYELLLEERAHNNFVYDIMEALRESATLHGLNEVQLTVDFVQNIPYDEFAGVDKYPVETLLAGTGDCSDKSLLLGQLLEMMGYSCTLLLYSEAKHMALGLEVDALRDDVDRLSANTVYVETTTPHPIGRFPSDENVGTYSTPVSIAVGLGGGELPMPGYLNYLAEVDSMTALFGKDYVYSDSREREVLRELRGRRTAQEEASEALESLRAEFEARKTEWAEAGCIEPGDVISAECPEVVDEWNEYVNRINQAVQEVNSAIDAFNESVEEWNA